MSSYRRQSFHSLRPDVAASSSYTHSRSVITLMHVRCTALVTGACSHCGPNEFSRRQALVCDACPKVGATCFDGVLAISNGFWLENTTAVGEYKPCTALGCIDSCLFLSGILTTASLLSPSLLQFMLFAHFPCPCVGIYVLV